MATRSEYLTRYKGYSYNLLVNLAKKRNINYIPKNPTALAVILANSSVGLDAPQREGIKPNDVKTYKVKEIHQCDCTHGEYKERHRSYTYILFLHTGRKREVRFCANDVGLVIPIKIEGRKLKNGKHCVSHGLMIPIQHYLAQFTFDENGR